MAGKRFPAPARGNAKGPGGKPGPRSWQGNVSLPAEQELGPGLTRAGAIAVAFRADGILPMLRGLENGHA